MDASRHGGPLPRLHNGDLNFTEKDLPLLRDLVRACQRLKVGGRHGPWADFLTSPEAHGLSKKARGRRDPGLHSWNVLAAFIKTLTDPALTHLQNKQQYLNASSAAQGQTGPSADELMPNRGGTAEFSPRTAWDLVDQTRAHHKFKNSYRLPSLADGWVVVPQTPLDHASEPRLLALDCEMCKSSKSIHELVRVAVVDEDGNVVLDRLVKPQAEVLDYRESVTGISAAKLEDVKYTRADAQADVVKLLSGNVVLVGHSLDNDLKSLQLDFQPVIDTSFLFRYKGLSTCSPGLADLHRILLDAVLREEGQPHDCRADAFAAMALVHYEMHCGPSPELDALPLVVPKEDLKKLLVHSIPPGLTSADLLATFTREGWPGDIAVDGNPEKEKKVFLVFANPALADQAFKILKAKTEKDSRGRAQKCIPLCQGLAAGKLVRVRKMAAHNGLAFGSDMQEKRDRTPAERAFGKKRKLNSP